MRGRAARARETGRIYEQRAAREQAEADQLEITIEATPRRVHDQANIVRTKCWLEYEQHADDRRHLGGVWRTEEEQRDWTKRIKFDDLFGPPAIPTPEEIRKLIEGIRQRVASRSEAASAEDEVTA